MPCQEIILQLGNGNSRKNVRSHFLREINSLLKLANIIIEISNVEKYFAKSLLDIMVEY